MIEFVSMNGGVRDARLHCVRYFCAVGRLADHFESDLVAVMPEEFVKLLGIMKECLSSGNIKVENVKVNDYAHDCLCIICETPVSIYGVCGYIVDADDLYTIKAVAAMTIESARTHMDIDRKLRALSMIESSEKQYSSSPADGLYE